MSAEGGNCATLQADIRSATDCAAITTACMEHYARIDILHNNVGIGRGDAGPTTLTEENWDNIFAVNLKGMFMTCKHALPVMREQRGGAIVNISSVAAIASTGMLAYKTSKAGVIALTQNLAMAIEGYSSLPGRERARVIAERDARVPLRNKMGSAWDVAYAALFLASDEAKFITGVVLPVDGGQSIRVG